MRVRRRVGFHGPPAPSSALRAPSQPQGDSRWLPQGEGKCGADSGWLSYFSVERVALGGLKFRRQHPIPPYVADFHCEELKLVIELDGSRHDEAVDRARTKALERQGLFVLRFWDNQVLLEVDAVLEAFMAFAQERGFALAPRG